MQKKIVIIVIILGISLLAIFIFYNYLMVMETSIDNIKVGTFSANASVHDPSIIAGEDDTYYIFGSHMEAAMSTDLRMWESFATGVDANNKLFDNLFDDSLKAFAYVGKNTDGGYSVWAPDVIYNEAMGKYMMYFCTTSSFIKSNICFATADNIEGPYTYQDTILYSGFNQSTMELTNVSQYADEESMSEYFSSTYYNHLIWPNCIDPSVFYDANKNMWLTYGSWSGGIYILEIDESTGYPIHPEDNPDQEVDSYYGKKLLGGLHNSIEGSYILYDATTQYYYLFVSYGVLTSEGGYQIRVFRSKEPDGTYVDTNGENCGAVASHAKYGLKLMGNYDFPSLSTAYMAPGHNSAFIDKDGKMYIAYHQRFNDGTEYHEPRVHQIFTNQDGWIVVAPFATNGETISANGYRKHEVIGTYYMVNHETDISKEIHSSQEIKLNKNGTITGAVSGNWTMEKNTYYMSMEIDGVTYNGVFLQMIDEAGNPVMTFSAAGDNNETLWGGHYQ